jgi:uncharacterized SAM-binding protein YcdF (DUF218 family)
VPRAARSVRNLLALIGALYLSVTVTPVVSWWARALAGPWNDPKGDILIVLGGSLLDKDVIGMNSYWRSVYAAKAYQEDGFRKIVISGGGGDQTPIANPMREFIVYSGVPREATDTETTSNSTRENALNTVKMLRSTPGRKVLMTSDYHMFRARRAFRKAGLDAAPRPIPDVIKRASAWPERWTLFVELLVETAKIGYYYARGWI